MFDISTKFRADDTQQVRYLKELLKSANKQLGTQGATIYNLRNEVQALQSNADIWSQGDRHRLYQKVKAEQEENRLLREKLNANSQAVEGDSDA